MTVKQQTVLDEFNKQIEEHRKQGCNIPGIDGPLTMVPAMMAPVATVIRLDTNPEKKEIRPLDNNGSAYEITAQGYFRFRIAGQIEFTEVTSTSPDKNLIKYKVTGTRFDMTGTPVVLTDEKAIDLKAYESAKRSAEEAKVARFKGTDQQKKSQVERTVDAYITNLRKYGAERCITGAESRITRKLLGLRSSYTLKELEKPFIIVSMVPYIDTDDAETKRILVFQRLKITDRLYEHPVGAPVAAEAIDGREREAAAPAGGPAIGADAPAAPAIIEDDFEDLPRSVQISRIRKLLTERGSSISMPLEEMGSTQLTGVYDSLMLKPAA